MKKIIKKISGVIQIILLAPVKLPGKVLDIMKYIGLGLGIIESVIEQDGDTNVQKQNKGQDCVEQDDDVGDMESEENNEPDHHLEQLQIVKYDLETGEEVIHETK